MLTGSRENTEARGHKKKKNEQRGANGYIHKREVMMVVWPWLDYFFVDEFCNMYGFLSSCKRDAVLVKDHWEIILWKYLLENCTCSSLESGHYKFMNIKSFFRFKFSLPVKHQRVYTLDFMQSYWGKTVEDRNAVKNSVVGWQGWCCQPGPIFPDDVLLRNVSEDAGLREI